MATRVLGGMHSGMSFMPTNGVAARSRIEEQVMALRARGVKNPRGRLLDEQNERRRRKVKIDR